MPPSRATGLGGQPCIEYRQLAAPLLAQLLLLLLLMLLPLPPMLLLLPPMLLLLLLLPLLLPGSILANKGPEPQLPRDT